MRRWIPLCMAAAGAFALAALVLAAVTLPSSASAYSYAGVLATESGPLGGNAQLLSCLGASPEMIVEDHLTGEFGSTVDALGRGHATMNVRAYFSLYAPDPVQTDQPGELLWTGRSDPVHYSVLVDEWPEEGFVVTPFDSVSFEVVNQVTGAHVEIAITVIGYFFPENGGVGGSYGVPYCPA